MDLSGVHAPIPTPFTDDGHTIDLAGARRNAERWVSTGLRGLVVLGSNGEAPLVGDGEADQLVDVIREVVPRDRWLIVGVGRESTRATIAASRRAAAAGADAVLVRTPGFFKPHMSDRAFFHHFTAVADGSPVPVVVYNFTALTGVLLPVSVAADLSRHPNLIGMKESGSDLGYVSSLAEETAPGFQLLVGSAGTFFASLMCGAVGGILALACVVPDRCLTIYDLVRKGRLDEARTVQRQVASLARLVTRVHGVSGLKAALDLTGYTGGPPRLPLLPVEPAARAAIAAALVSCGEHPVRAQSGGARG